MSETENITWFFFLTGRTQRRVFCQNFVKITRILTADEGLTAHEITVRCGTLQPDCTTVEFSDIALCTWFVHMSKLAEKNKAKQRGGAYRKVLIWFNVKLRWRLHLWWRPTWRSLISGRPMNGGKSPVSSRRLTDALCSFDRWSDCPSRLLLADDALCVA